MDSEVKEKILKLMRFWLLGTFIIVFAAVTAYTFIWLSMAPSFTFGHVIQAAWPVWALTAVACLALYFGYKFLYLKNR